jgi:hypothetical protein
MLRQTGMTTPLPPQPPRETDLVDPTEAEIQEWADRERQRRAAWLEGPTQDQKAEWARRERERRLGERPGQSMMRGFALTPELPFRYARTAQLAGEGALSLLWKWSQHGLQTLVNEGRAWEDEFAPRGPRRVRVDDRTLE